MSSAHLTGGGIHTSHQDGTIEADGRSRHFSTVQQCLPHVCHELSMGLGCGVPTTIPETHLHSTARQVPSAISLNT